MGEVALTGSHCAAGDALNHSAPQGQGSRRPAEGPGLGSPRGAGGAYSQDCGGGSILGEAVAPSPPPAQRPGPWSCEAVRQRLSPR